MFRKPFERRNLRAALLAASATAIFATGSAPALAQQKASLATEEIIVTARKREESILQVPVIETVMTKELIEQRAISTISDMVTYTPGLGFSQSALSSGATASIRGFGTFALNPGVDNSVAFVIDGLSFANGLAYQSGSFDLAQIEILKGPQSLFFGKSSPAGVISLRTADPGDHLEVVAKAQVEAEARQRRGEFAIGGPVNDTLGLRLAGAVDASDGYFRNPAQALANTGALTPRDRVGGNNSIYLRGTAVWKPSSKFDLRFKANYSKETLDYAGAVQMASCPEGVAPHPGGVQTLNPADDCKLDKTIYLVDTDPAAFPGAFNDEGGHQFGRHKQFFGTVEMNYRPTDNLELTSVTGYYDFRARTHFSTFQAGYAMNSFSSDSAFFREAITEELRLNSDYSGPVNFSGGGFIQHERMVVRTTTAPNYILTTTRVPVLSGTDAKLDIQSQSVFGQLRYRPTPEVEIAGGGRYTHEKRQNAVFDAVSTLKFSLPTPVLTSNTFSPEVTLSYFLNSDTTLFASFKRGYKSGSFALGRLATRAGVILDNSFGDEKVTGGEGGVKARLASGQITTSLTPFYYNFKGLQFSISEATNGQLPATRVVNAGNSRIYGADFDITYKPVSTPGLDLHAAVEYNNSKFTDLRNVPCYGGQTIALGCNQAPANPAVQDAFTAQQNLAGIPMVRAPQWDMTFGATYKFALSNAYNLTLTNDHHFTSRQLLNVGNRADFYQKGFYKVDLSAIVSGPDNTWEVALIGKNLNDKVTAGSCSTSNYANLSTTAQQLTGRATNGADGVDELGCFAERGRSIILRVTARPFG